MVGVEGTKSVLLTSHGLHWALLWTELSVPGVSRWWLVVVAVVSSHTPLHSHSHHQVERREIQCPGELEERRDFSDHFR